jgi:hypothetical protein
MESEGGSWDFDMEVGIDNAAIPASILDGLVSHGMELRTGDILMCFWSKTSTDVLCWHIGEFWSDSHDSFA